MRVRRAALCAALCLLGGSGASAQETLYGKQPPRGSSFVRFVNALPSPALVRTNFLPEARLGTAPGDRVGSYGVIDQAAGRSLSVTVEAGPLHGALEFKAAPDSYVTVALEAGADGTLALVPIADQAEFNQNRARVSFYNLSPGCASAALVLDPGGPAVFQGVASGSGKSRTVNPVQAVVKAVCGEAPAPAVKLEGLEVGASYSVWLMQPGAAASLFLTQDRLTPYKPKG